jgi:hypothetical protein
VEALWNGNYNAIAKAKSSIKALDASPIADDLKAQYQGSSVFKSLFLF